MCVCICAYVYWGEKVIFQYHVNTDTDCVCNNVVPALKSFDNYQIKNEKVMYELLLLFLASEDCMMLP